MGYVGGYHVNTKLWSDDHTWTQDTQDHVSRPPGLMPSWSPNPKSHIQVSDRWGGGGGAMGLPLGQSCLGQTL